MAAPRKSGSLLARSVAAAALAALCWSASLRALDFALAGAAAGARAPSQVQRRYSIFDGINLPSVGGPEQDPDEVGTRSQREVDSGARLVECSLPLGIEFEEKDGGDIYIKNVEQGTDAWEQGVRPGAHLTMLSATFGDEMWSARKVGMTQFYQTLNSRFGNTISLALEKENQNVLSSFFASFAPKPETEEDKKRKANMGDVFEREEAKLQDKSFWNPFR